MSSVGKTERILEVLRHTAKKDPTPGARPGSQAAPNSAAELTPKFDFQADLALRIAAIPANGPPTPEQNVQAFLESCVAQVFGPLSVNDPGFLSAMARARTLIESDLNLQTTLHRALSQLKG